MRSLEAGHPVPDESGEAAARERGLPLAVVTLTEPEVRAVYERRLVLVRPDDHVAWRADAVPTNALAVS